jgi:hypothetical protein
MLGGGEALRLFSFKHVECSNDVKSYHISKAPDRVLLQNVCTIFFKA